MASLLSIIVPTKNRSKYCIECLKHITSLNLNDIEVIVQDNSDTDELKHLIEVNNLGGSIKYNYHSEALSFVRNFSLGIEASTGEYITMIGDDDTVLPNIVEIASIAKQRDYDAVIPQLNCYFWPSQTPIVPRYANGYLASRPFRHKRFIEVNTKSALKSLIADNFGNYQSYNVPRVYHGIVRKQALERVKTVAGDYFQGLTPDMFMSIALCFTAQKSYTYTQPISISGICPKSGSNDSATGKHTGQLQDAPHFRGHDLYTWCNKIPAIYSVETIWAETAMQALKIFDSDGYFISMYNPESFVKQLNFKYPQFTDELRKFCLCSGISADTISANGSYQDNTRRERFISRFKRLMTLDIARHYRNVSNISEACDILSQLYKL